MKNKIEPPPAPQKRIVNEDIKIPSKTFSIITFLLGVALAIGASHSLEHSPKKPKKCHCPDTLEAICNN